MQERNRGQMRPLVVALFCSLSAATVALVVALLWSLGSASGERDRFSSLAIAPRDADIFVAINTDPTSPQWLAVNDSLDEVNAKDPIRRAIDEALAEVNLDWEEDILPIAGDEGFFSVPDVSGVGDDGGYVAGFRVRDTGKAQEVFDSLRERAAEQGEEYETEEYEGVTIYVTVEPDLDGDPTTESDCRVDEEGTILCDGSQPIPENPEWKCAEIGFELSLEGRSTTEAPEECQPFFECPAYWDSQEGEGNLEDLDGNGQADSCDEADQIMREWELSIDLAQPYQDCAELEDIEDYRCEDVSTLVGTGGAVAVFQDVIAIGASAEEIKAVIDVVQGRATSAEENERLQEFREAQKEDFLMWGYADLAPVWDMAEAATLTDSGGDGDSGDIHLEPEPIGTPAPATTEPEGGFRVTSFDAEYTINESGALIVKETIAVDFGTAEKHGILRALPTRISYDSSNDETLRVDNFLVKRDGVGESMEGELAGDYFELRIGDPAVTITGQHTYELEYTVQGGIRQNRWGGPDAYYELRWVATGDLWPAPIEASSITVNTPRGTIDQATCHVGAGEFGEQDLMPCRATFDAGTARFVPEGPISPGAGLHFSIGVNGESGAPPPDLVPAQDFPLEETGSPSDEEPREEFPLNVGTEELFNELRGTYDRVGFSISATGDGFALDLTVLHAPDFEPKYAPEPTKVFDSQFADSVPADTMFFFAGYDLYGQSWVPTRDYLEETDSPDGATLDDFLGEFITETGLDLEEDILALMTGEYAVAGDITGFDAETPEYKILAMLDIADAPKAQQSLDELGEYLEGEGAVEVSNEEGVQRWTITDSDAEVVGIAVDGDTLIAGYPDSTAGDAIAGFDDSLGGTDDWKRTMDVLPADTTSIGFVSISRILEEIRAMPDAKSAFEEATDGEMTLDDLTPIRSLGFATTSRENGFGLHLVLFMEDR